MSYFSFKIAYKYLWTKRKEAFISIISIVSLLGIAIGVGVLNIVMAIMTGFEYELQHKIIGVNSHIILKKQYVDINENEDVAGSVKSIQKIKTISPFVYRQAILKYRNTSHGILIKGIKEGTDAVDKLFDGIKNKDKSILFKKSEHYNESENHTSLIPSIIVGKQLSLDLGIYEGAIVTLLSSSMQSSPFGLMPQYKRFIVKGIYDIGLPEYESSLAYVDMKEAQSLFEMKGKVSGYEFYIDDMQEAPFVAKEIQDTLSKKDISYFTQTWIDTNKPLWDAMQLEKKTYFIVLLLIIIMASFSVVTTLVMIVLEKRKDIAILKTLGASTKEISHIFISMGVVIGFFGTILGIILGLAGCFFLKEYGFPLDPRVFPVSQVPVRVIPLNVVMVSLSSFLISLVATIYPAIRASKLNPSEVLRYE